MSRRQAVSCCFCCNDWRSVAVPCSVRRGTSQALTADGSDAERRRVARARLAARVCHGLVPLLVAAIMAHEAVPMRVGVGVRVGAPESHRRCAAALVAKQAVAAAALPHLVEVKSSGQG